MPKGDRPERKARRSRRAEAEKAELVAAADDEEGMVIEVGGEGPLYAVSSAVCPWPKEQLVSMVSQHEAREEARRAGHGPIGIGRCPRCKCYNEVMTDMRGWSAAMPGLIEAVVLVKRADNGLEWPLSAGARHSWAEIEARGRTIREDFAAEYGLTLPLVAIDLGRWDKGDGPFEAVT